MIARLPHLRWLPALAPAAALAACLLAAGTAQAGAACPNEARRIEQGATALPRCRAYELVTPGQMVSSSKQARAASGGGALTYYSTTPAPAASSTSYFYLARRGAAGWTDLSVGPQDEAAALMTASCEQNVFFSPDLSSNILEAGWFEAKNPARCARPHEIVPGEPFPYRNVFVHDLSNDSYRLVNVTPEDAIPANAEFQDASDDLSEVVFGEEAQLTLEAPSGYDFYVWKDGVVRLLTILPDGSPAPGELVEPTDHAGLPGTGLAPVTGAVSDNGRRAFFYSDGGLYLRDNPDQPQSAIVGGACTEPLRACTAQVDASQGPGPSGGGVFSGATADGSAVFFTDQSRLTTDSTAEGGKPDLYRFDAESGLLTDLTVHAGEAADVRAVDGIAQDGSYVYFVANGALAPGAQPGNCPGTAEAPGHCSLYALHEGSIRFVGTDALAANASPNGRFLAFTSTASQTGYDNPSSTLEIFLYSVAANGGSGELSCASCQPGSASSLPTTGNYAPSIQPDPFTLAANFASWRLNAVLDDGSVFFNGDGDVYEYRDGQLHLITPGGSAAQARFLDASADGADVFFQTGQSLIGSDAPGQSIYDARVYGGFAERPAPPGACEGEACRGPIQPPPTALEPGTPRRTVTPRPRCRRPHRPKRCRKHGHHKHRHRRTGK